MCVCVAYILLKYIKQAGRNKKKSIGNNKYFHLTEMNRFVTILLLLLFELVHNLLKIIIINL